MKKRLSILLLVFLCLIPLCPAAQADMGPKPSVEIELAGLAGRTCYATLLSAEPSTGPYSAVELYGSNGLYPPDHADYPIYEKFVAYQDPDGFYFLQYFQPCTTGRFTWSYYPPETFKILLYFPQEDCFVSSAPTKRYAFDSRFTADLSGLDLTLSPSESPLLAVSESWDWSGELLSLLVRIVLTVCIELLVALFFFLRTKKQLLLILAVNLCTQTLLNLLLNLINYHWGGLAYVLNYVWMELLVFAVEAVLYALFLPKCSSSRPLRRWVPAVYALIANILSFGAGMLLSFVLPGVF